MSPPRDPYDTPPGPLFGSSVALPGADAPSPIVVVDLHMGGRKSQRLDCNARWFQRSAAFSSLDHLHWDSGAHRPLHRFQRPNQSTAAHLPRQGISKQFVVT
ncbi:hypothetical protein ColLi_03267 [Colletotrichum liriopes]|uniref:Uncharacterized protein n=1 Tax=Colletotrichum liriopes TaxID=708192 RepID=A0AA37GGC6_9PEZI|nr:hypothetical protein ColLi_03267 [Colletotrichum liriopes]